MTRAALLLSVGLLSTACRAARTDVQDELQDAATLAGDGFVNAPAADLVTPDPNAWGESWGERWWERFQDPSLNTLVEATLAGNLDLVQAAARVREADARARSARGGRGPSVDAAFAASRSVVNSPGDTPGGGRTYSSLFTPQVAVAWQADLFGRLRATERARLADALASDEDRLALAHSLVAEAARLRVRISLLDRERALAMDIVDSRTRTVEIVEGRYRGGVSGASAVDVHQARENLAAARAALPAFDRELERTYLALDVLLGAKPGRGLAVESLGAPLPNAEPPPVGIPAGLLDRRPDLRAARLTVESAAAEVDASLAALYPDLTLSGNAGWSDDELGDLFSAETFFAGLAGNLAAPLFASGRLEADVDAARARLDGLVAAYAGSVLRAVREVEDALVAERGLLAELGERTFQRDEARLAEDLARERYRRGLENLLTVLDTERRRASAEDQVLLLQAAVWNARIDLHLALGGDWFPAEPEESAEPEEPEGPEEPR